jgi:hypothetical protein
VSTYKTHDNPDFFFSHVHKSHSAFEPDRELLRIEDELRRRHLLEDPVVQWLMRLIRAPSSNNRTWAVGKLQLLLDSEHIMDLRTGDHFRPLAPSQRLSQGDLHLLDQVDGTKWTIPANALTRGMLLTGMQGGGKSRFLLGVTKQLSEFDPPIPFLILDPKQELRCWAAYLHADYVDIGDIAIDMSPPPGHTYETWFPSLMPQIGSILGVIYGSAILQNAGSICIAQHNKYVQATSSTEISLADIYQAVPLVDDTGKGRRLGYREAVETGISRILAGSGNLFRCRRGISLTDLFQHNVILGCRAITDDFAAKFLALYLIYWLYEASRFEPPTDMLRSVVAMDDAARFLSARQGFDAASKTSELAHIYAVLRSTGRGLIAATQIPSQADNGIAALSHTVVCIGGLHHTDDTRLLSHIMSLNEDQRIALTRLARREAVGICAGSAWPRPVHGFVPEVLNFDGGTDGKA